MHKLILIVKVFCNLNFEVPDYNWNYLKIFTAKGLLNLSWNTSLQVTSTGARQYSKTMSILRIWIWQWIYLKSSLSQSKILGILQCNLQFHIAINILLERKRKNCKIKVACTLIDSTNFILSTCNFDIFFPHPLIAWCIHTSSNSIRFIAEDFSVYVRIFSLFVRKLSKCSQVKKKNFYFI